MGLLGHSMETLSRNKSRSKSDASQHSVDGAPENDTSTLDKEEGNVLGALISQLRPGMDLSKIALPTFVLEPRSLLERITDFFSHPELIFGAGEENDDQERFLMAMTFYLSGWHIKPKGVKKPYNPVLGEFFRCSYTYPDGSEGFYVAEQVSHHPPVSAFFYVSPKNGVLVTGELKPKSKFLGNSAATIMEGEDRMRLLNRPGEEYVITMPNTYARGILFGKMVLELCDVSSITCQKTGYSCDVDFKAKGWISGGYNAIEGHVKNPKGETAGEVTGYWSSKMEFHEKKSGTRDVIFDPGRSKVVQKDVLPESEQEENESRRLWTKLTDAIKATDMHGATAEKSAVEDRQRELAKKREANGEAAPPARFFVHVAGDRWMPSIDVDSLPKDPAAMVDKVRSWIFGGKAVKRDTTSASHSPAAPASTTQFNDTASVRSTASATSTAPPPTAPTAPGPPAPGPKASHPI